MDSTLSGFDDGQNNLHILLMHGAFWVPLRKLPYFSWLDLPFQSCRDMHDSKPLEGHGNWKRWCACDYNIHRTGHKHALHLHADHWEDHGHCPMIIIITCAPLFPLLNDYKTRHMELNLPLRENPSLKSRALSSGKRGARVIVIIICNSIWRFRKILPCTIAKSRALSSGKRGARMTIHGISQKSLHGSKQSAQWGMCSGKDFNQTSGSIPRPEAVLSRWKKKILRLPPWDLSYYARPERMNMRTSTEARWAMPPCRCGKQSITEPGGSWLIL